MLKVWLVFALFGHTVGTLGPIPASDCQVKLLEYEAKANLAFSTLAANDPSLRFGGKFIGSGDVKFSCQSGEAPPALDESWPK
jgi:hypothetical protein